MILLSENVFGTQNNLLKFRGASTSTKDGDVLTALERAMELGSITDEELFTLLAGH